MRERNVVMTYKKNIIIWHSFAVDVSIIFLKSIRTVIIFFAQNVKNIHAFSVNSSESKLGTEELNLFLN